MEQELHAYMDIDRAPVLVGRLWARERTGRESSSFTYDPAWIKRRGAFALAPSLPLVPGPFHAAKGLHPAFSDSAPDAWGRKLMLRQERARARGFAASEVQINETETPLHKLETVYRRLVERLGTADTGVGAFRGVIDGWFYALEQDVLADESVDAGNADELLARTDALMEARLATINKAAPAFSAVLRTYRRAVADGDTMLADGLISWLAGQPNVAAAKDADTSAYTAFQKSMATIIGGSNKIAQFLDRDTRHT